MLLDVVRGREEILEQPIPALDARTSAVELFALLPRCIPVLSDRTLLGSERGTIELYQVPAVAQEHPRVLNQERRRLALGLVESVEAGRGGVRVVVTVREDRDVLRTLLRREKREEDADRHLLSRELQALIGKRISVCRHQQVDEDDIEESFREVSFTTKDRLPLAVAIGGYQAVLPTELPPGGVLVDGIVVNDEDLHGRVLFWNSFSIGPVPTLNIAGYQKLVLLSLVTYRCFITKYAKCLNIDEIVINMLYFCC